MYFIVRVHGYGRPELEFFDSADFAIKSFNRKRAKRVTELNHSWTQLWIDRALWDEF